MDATRTMGAPFIDWDSYEWTGVDRQAAVEMFGDQIVQAVIQNEGVISLPRHAAEVIHACAKDGARKGQGRGNAMTPRRRAVELFEDQIAIEEGAITLPLDTAKIILACARDGLNRGQGRRRPRGSRRDQLSQRAIAVWVRDEKEKDERLTKARRTIGATKSAEDDAVENVRAQLLTLYKSAKINSTTIKLMQSNTIKQLTQKEMKRQAEKRERHLRRMTARAEHKSGRD
jgi:hypothetical protein